MYSFICRYTEHSIALPVLQPNGEMQNKKITVRNGIITTEDEKIANALRDHPHFGVDWFEDKKNRKVVNEFRKPEEQTLSDYLNSLGYHELKRIAKDKKISKYPELKTMKQVDLISRMIEKRHLLGEYDVRGD